MTQTTKTRLGISLLTALACLLALPAMAADAPLADVEIGSAAVSFHPANAGRLTLSVNVSRLPMVPMCWELTSALAVSLARRATMLRHAGMIEQAKPMCLRPIQPRLAMACTLWM